MMPKAFNIKNEDTETERILRTYMSSAKPNFKNNDKEKLIQELNLLSYKNIKSIGGEVYYKNVFVLFRIQLKLLLK